MKANKFLAIMIFVIQTACQLSVTPTVLPSPTKAISTVTLMPTVTSQPTDIVTVTITPTQNQNLDYWNELQYDTRKWTEITYNDIEWTPQTYPIHTLEPVLTHNFIENCMIYPEEGHGLPADTTYKEVPVIIGGHFIFDERVFLDENGKEMFMVIVGSYHVDYPYNADKSDCIKDSERVVMTGMGGGCSSGDCGYCPGLPYTNLKIGDLVMLVNPEVALPVTEPGGNVEVGNKDDWYFSDGGFVLKVIDGPVCENDNAWWQLRNPNNVFGWDSDNHFIVQP